MPTINIPITQAMIDRVHIFSEQVVDETYDRFNQDRQTRFDRIFVGKLGELCLSHHLYNLTIRHDIHGMFELYEGIENVDAFDFVVPNTHETIDVKTAYKSFHSRILIPFGPNGQWDQMPKDFYVGVKLIGFPEEDGHIRIHGLNNVFASIYGYVPRNDDRWKGPNDFGEGPAMWIFLNKLAPIQNLVNRMRQ